MTEGCFTRCQTRETGTGRAAVARRLVAVVALAVALAVMCVTLPASARAQDTVPQGVRIGLNYSGNGKPGVAFTPIAGPNADSVRAMLVRDLDFSDRMTVIAPDSGDPPTGTLNYDLYAKLNAVAVVQAVVTPAGALHVSVHDVVQKRVLMVMDMLLPEPALSVDWRRIVHVAADSVEWAVLGQRGISSTRVLFVRTTQTSNQIWSVDADGEGLRPVPGTDGALSPAWGPKGARIAYGVLPSETGKSRIVVRDLGTGQTWSTRAGDLNLTPTFSPDGSQVVFASGSDGTDLYSATPFTSGSAKRLTVRRGSSNTTPTFSPDGRKIAFTSSILGHPEVYIMDADGSSDDLLTASGFGDDLYRSDPSWSPDGRRVAFDSHINHVFQVMTINVRDGSTTQLTSEGRNEDPSWAPDGRHIVFTSTRSGTKQLWVLDTESFRSRQLTHGGTVQNPAWSPRLDFSRQP